MEVLKQKRKLYSSGLKSKLETENYPVTITIDSENETSLVNVNEELTEL